MVVSSDDSVTNLNHNRSRCFISTHENTRFFAIRHKDALVTFELRQRHNTMPFVVVVTGLSLPLLITAADNVISWPCGFEIFWDGWQCIANLPPHYELSRTESKECQWYTVKILREGIIQRSFIHLDTKTLAQFYTVLVRPTLIMLPPSRPLKNIRKNIEKLECFQRRSTKQVPGLQTLDNPGFGRRDHLKPEHCIEFGKHPE
ncbi:hypothetical protein CAPTEDRAFT_210714 [Capitella teleta]|uniref:Uncharacterized protein n=1 Tax=Capitella teleta TaxID=283909 RepID=R7UDI2_CAPTE|nr:hypothetical protein CAPTEDRAFT_210714 [Capitella teleta]|eukprot:ELU04171.1 hypothetical protein CAPTEDRAFT_210714 [Capitella teleta]